MKRDLGLVGAGLHTQVATVACGSEVVDGK